MDIYVKDPDAVLDYTVDWEAWLKGDTIASSTFTVEEIPNVTGLVNNYEDKSDTTTTVWLSGGAVGIRYKVTNRIVTAAARPRTDERSFYVRVAEK
jgi:hypothetical protein